MQLKKIARRAADAVGYVAFPKYLDANRPMAERLRILFRKHGIERIIDVGANKGQFHDFIRHDVESDLPVHSFEPDPDLVAVLHEKHRGQAGAWTITQCALGAETTTGTFHRMALDVYNSFLMPIADAEHPRNAVSATFEVVVKRLDDLLPELGDLSRTFIKIDTQGWDLEVLKGGPEAFVQVPMVQTELSFRPIYQGCPTWIQSVEAFQAAGFGVSDIFMVRYDDLSEAVEGDAILTKSSLGQ